MKLRTSHVLIVQPKRAKAMIRDLLYIWQRSAVTSSALSFRGHQTRTCLVLASVNCTNALLAAATTTDDEIHWELLLFEPHGQCHVESIGRQPCSRSSEKKSSMECETILTVVEDNNEAARPRRVVSRVPRGRRIKAGPVISCWHLPFSMATTAFGFTAAAKHLLLLKWLYGSKKTWLLFDPQERTSSKDVLGDALCSRFS